MRNNCLILLTVLALTDTVFGRQLALSGYYENQFFPQELGGELILQDYNKIRIDLSSQISENISFNGNYNYRVFHGKTRFNALDFIPASVVERFTAESGLPVDAIRPFLDFEQQDENFLDNAFATIYGRHFSLRIGKQQLPWGTGYTWNPTDIFNDKNALDPTYEKVGVNAFKLEVPLGLSSYISGILSIADTWRRSTKAIKAKTHLHGFDATMSFVQKNQEIFDLDLQQENFERRNLIGADLSGELLGLGLWAETAYNFMEKSGNFGQYLVGIDYTLENGLYFIGEYFRNELGKSSKDRYTLLDWARLLGSEAENLGRDYIFAGQMYPIAELWSWSNYLLFNLNDGSGIVFPWFDYSLNDNTELIFVGYVPFGSRGSEFGEIGKGGFARIRVYF